MSRLLPTNSITSDGQEPAAILARQTGPVNIELRGVAVHNLKQVDLDIPQHQLVVLCGVSGSGKTSLALDTLYAEGQRRYIESFSLYTRQFLERLDKPAAERIDGLPAAIAVTRDDVSRSSRATIGTATETIDYLRLLYAKIGRLTCPGCGQAVGRSTPESVAQRAAEQDERGQREGVGIDRPCQSGRAGVEVLVYRGQRDVDDGRVEQRHAGARDRRGQHPPSARFIEGEDAHADDSVRT